MRLVGSVRSASWATDALALLDDCTNAVEAQAQAAAGTPPPVRRLLRELDARYRERLLDEPSFAEGWGKSASYVAHMLKHHTGRTFLQHIHARRTEEAYRELIRSSKSVEEIARSVGYAGATQLRRHLRKQYGLTARDIRSGKAIATR